MPAKFQVVTVKPFSGTSKAGNAYSMLVVGGLFTSEDGVVEMGEISFMQGRDRPLPTNIFPGTVYTPVLGAEVRDGKLGFKITELRALASSSVSPLSSKSSG